ncbi:prepilin-type N-terminal cleavage/methylation domain-containing protein [Vibrio mediterranei]|uniref:prepilin-type N-terminal cleavage/methylation domain-containing protein n=1 Tax=Vibrio mediterranei TaxID=689 RepID=UPI0038CEA036
MTVKRQQRGFGLLEVVIGVALLAAVAAWAVPQYLEKKKDEAAESFSRDIRFLVDQVHQYQYHKVTKEGKNPNSTGSWPAAVLDVMTEYPGEFWNNCTVAAEQDGKCRRPDSVPWSNAKITSQVFFNILVSNSANLVLLIPTHTLVSDTREWTRWTTPLMRLPGAHMDPSGDVGIILRSSTLALMFDNIVMRNGQATLTDDWDVGGDSAITNVKDITLAGKDPSKNDVQVPVSDKLYYSRTVQHGDWVAKPSCANGTSPDIHMSIGSKRVDTSRYEYMGTELPFLIEQDTSRWRIGLDIMVRDINTRQPFAINTGTVVVNIGCQ